MFVLIQHYNKDISGCKGLGCINPWPILFMKVMSIINYKQSDSGIKEKDIRSLNYFCIKSQFYPCLNLNVWYITFVCLELMILHKIYVF